MRAMVRTNIYGPYHGGIPCHKKEVLEHYELSGKWRIAQAKEQCQIRNGRLFNNVNVSVAHMKTICTNMVFWNLWLDVSGN